METDIRLEFNSSVENLVDINDSFSSATIRICYSGQNRNGSVISKETIERAIPTMFNCPVVCNYDVEEDTIGSHDVALIHTDDGGVKLVNLTDAIGVIPQDARTWWSCIEDDGVSHDYLNTEAILWKRSPAYQKIKDDGICSQSMEINVKSGHMNDGVFVIEDFTFTAFCLLGENVTPCFESASLQMFCEDNIKNRYSTMMNELKNSFTTVNASVEVDINLNNNPLEGGEEHLEQKMELLTKFGLNAEQLDFDIADISLEELEERLNEKCNNTGDAGSQFTLSGEQFREELIGVLRAEKVKTEWGEMCRYSYCDYDADSMEVFCYDTEDWKLYGFPYSLNGDNINIDFACKKRKKFSIVDFDEGDKDVSYKEMFDIVVEASVASKTSTLNAEFEVTKTELEEKYNAASDTINQLNNEVNELRNFKQAQLEIKRTADEDAIFAMFVDLNGIEAFEALKNNCSELSIEELEDKCFAIRGRNTAQTFSAQKQKTPRLPVEKSNMADEPYGGLFQEFPPNR